ncbi:MAG TPA: NAD(P)-dependent oxidoreductase [Pyrinomonadaceae bacterium]|nr:NAD(P)-dependent oxidoreductase [Pyrinomonadaceae bacterium]
MSHSQSPPLEVTRSLLDCARAARFDFGEDTALVAVQHMLQQTIDFFQTAADMGLTLKNIFALGKIYSNSFPVIKTLRDMGVTVVETTVPPPGEFHSYLERDVDRLWKIAAEALAQRRIRRVLVLDDAGVCITRVPAEILQQYAVCGVEQTSSGIFQVEEKPPPFAVISWARAAVKLQMGGPIFARWLIEKLKTDFLRGQSLRGKQLGIIGMGSIGRGVANVLLKHGCDVLFYDPDPHLHVSRLADNKLVRSNSLEELMLGCDYVLGCSGRNPFRGKWPLSHRPGIKLLSASSGDQEFCPCIRDIKEKPDFKIAPHTWDIVSEHGPSGRIHIAYLGYPYSFVSRRNEALPTSIVQFDIGGLLAALVQAGFFLEQCRTGRQQNRGIHRVSPEAQRFIYERWSRAMKDRKIDITKLFDYDPAVLTAARYDGWFIENTEPRPSERYAPASRVEDLMDQFVRQDWGIRARIRVGT